VSISLYIFMYVLFDLLSYIKILIKIDMSFSFQSAKLGMLPFCPFSIFFVSLILRSLSCSVSCFLVLDFGAI
jgi:hypothetical protein